MNQLCLQKRAQVVRCLVEGNSIRATVRMTGVAKNTVAKLLLDLGTVCSLYQDQHLRGLRIEQVQMDEIWAFVGMKQANVPEDKKDVLGYGDVYTWVAIDADTKLVFCWHLGTRDQFAADDFLTDAASRIEGRTQVTTDGHRAYQHTVRWAFKGQVDHARIFKTYGNTVEGQRRYSPPVCTGVEKRKAYGHPDMEKASTSYVERQNLTMRMGMRRFTRLTNAFSKKLENHAAAIALHFMHYNYCRKHQTLGTTPAIAAGVTDHVWTVDEVVRLLK